MKTRILTFNVQIRGRTLRLPNAVADLAKVLTGILRNHRINHQCSVFPNINSGLQSRQFVHWRPFPEPLHCYIARLRLGLTIELNLNTAKSQLHPSHNF